MEYLSALEGQIHPVCPIWQKELVSSTFSSSSVDKLPVGHAALHGLSRTSWKLPRNNKAAVK